jgi:hypothetical protein
MQAVRSMFVPCSIFILWLGLVMGTAIQFGALGGALATADANESARRAEAAARRQQTAMHDVDANTPVRAKMQ